MARTILRVGAAAWLLAGVAGIGLAAFGSAWLLRALPELAIDEAALGRAVATLSTGLFVVGLAHVAALRGLATAPWGSSAAILLSAFVAVALLSLAAAGVTSAATQPAAAAALLAGSGAALLAGAAYALAILHLVRERRLGRPV